MVNSLMLLFVVFTIVAIVFYGAFPAADIINLDFVWKGYNLKAYYMNQLNSEQPVYSSAGNDESSFWFRSYAAAGSCCGGGSASAGAKTNLINIEGVESIFIEMTGFGSASSSYASSSGASSIDVPSLKKSIAVATGSGSSWSFGNRLIKFENGVLTVPSGDSINIQGAKEIFLSFSTSASISTNGRTAESKIVVKDIVVSRKISIPESIPISTQVPAPDDVSSGQFLGSNVLDGAKNIFQMVIDFIKKLFGY